ncbi:MAG: biotin--[acetyl-CoA-carboxylase] ligase [Candidatus Paceibacterota bacterium]|jgi:BirA family biotin operon repressor/biotin-[acetyl-CoA-carboxylase] ligase|nr:biotin--[acetyl-CoA-carboxylase] ligase [Candidatus Paceibacterota bacterium]MDD5555292.1 biotin--[acetyl-CoA-carboxylase] ligase [Candidatus Paceibacterota bacterium]
MISIKRFKKISSTNAEARTFKPWTILVAEEQDSGRGRKGDQWFSPKGGLYFSLVLPKSDIHDLQILTVLAGLAVAKTVKDNFNLEPLIKLPNDVLINGKKVCGILTENIVGKEVKFSVIGIGLNTNISSFPPDLRKTATSLKLELKKEVNNEKIMKEIVSQLEKQLKAII